MSWEGTDEKSAICVEIKFWPHFCRLPTILFVSCDPVVSLLMCLL